MVCHHEHTITILITKFPILHVMRICGDLPNVSSGRSHAHRPRHSCPPIRIAVLPSCIWRPLSMGSVSAFVFRFSSFANDMDIFGNDIQHIPCRHPL